MTTPLSPGLAFILYKKAVFMQYRAKNKNAAAERRKTATAKKEKLGGGHMKALIGLLYNKAPFTFNNNNTPGGLQSIRILGNRFCVDRKGFGV
jgi:hypothetical protein